MRQMAFNRTTVECKNSCIFGQDWTGRAFNRTTVECKMSW